MPRTAQAAPPPGLDPIPSVPSAGDTLRNDLDYFSILAREGVYRKGSEMFHDVPVGRPYRVGKTWRQQTKAYPVVMGAEEAREKTRATGDRHDYYEAGAKCKKCAEAGSGGLISGWVLGGRKFANEHDHVTLFDPAVYGEVEVAHPEVADDEDAVADEAPALVEA